MTYAAWVGAVLEGATMSTGGDGDAGLATMNLYWRKYARNYVVLAISKLRLLRKEINNENYVCVRVMVLELSVCHRLFACDDVIQPCGISTATIRRKLRLASSTISSGMVCVCYILFYYYYCPSIYPFIPWRASSSYTRACITSHFCQRKTVRGHFRTCATDGCEDAGECDDDGVGGGREKLCWRKSRRITPTHTPHNCRRPQVSLWRKHFIR